MTMTNHLRALLVLLLAAAVAAVVLVLAQPKPAGAQSTGCDEVPTSVAAEDYWLRFKVPTGLMPDSQFDERPAKLQVHRIRPVYANGKCPSVSTQAAVLIHGRTIPAPALFDLRDPATSGGDLSVQEALARAGIDTFAPSLLGYGNSTRFDEGLNDPGNASLRECPGEYPEGCDSINPLARLINLLDQQGEMLLDNPLAGERRAHSSKFRFARTDVWVRDIDQVIDDAIDRAQPDDKKVALVGYSLAGQFVGRTLYANNPNKLLDKRSKVSAKVSRVVFLNSVFGITKLPNGTIVEEQTEEPNTDRPTFPLTLTNRDGSDASWTPVNTDPQACPGRVIDDTKQQVWDQTMEQDTVGSQWGTSPWSGSGSTGGLNRTPTFSRYGWNKDVAKQMSKPTLVIQGLQDGTLSTTTGTGTGRTIYNSLTSTPNKVLVEVECASHALMWEGADSWAGPHDMFNKALIEWIKSGTFNGAANGQFIVDEGGGMSAAP